MANLIISGGTTSAGLIAGAAATGAPYSVISVLSAAEVGPGELDDFIKAYLMSCH